MTYFIKIRDWILADFPGKQEEDILIRHKSILITNVILLYVIMQVVSVILSFSVGSVYPYDFYLSTIVYNLGLLFVLKTTQKLELVSGLFILAALLPLPFFIYTYGDMFLTNGLWIIILTLLAVFMLNKKWYPWLIIFGLTNLIYNSYIVYLDKGVSFEGYTTASYVGGIIDGVFVLSVLYMVVYQYIRFNNVVMEKIKTKNIVLQKQFETIEKQDALKTDLLREIHHRVKNNLQMVNSMIRFQKRTVKENESLEVLQKIEERILLMAKLHEDIYQSEEFRITDLQVHFKDMTSNLLRLKGEDQIKCLVEVGATVKLTNDEILYVGLLVNEFMINAIKHAFKDGCGEVKILLKRVNNAEIMLNVSDDGCGIKELEVENSPTLGQRLIKSFSRQLGGEVEIKSPKVGSEFELVFPSSY